MGIDESHKSASQEFSTRLKELLGKTYGSNRRLAMISGLGESTIRKLLGPDCNPTLSTLSTLGFCFGIEIKDFFSENNIVEIQNRESYLFDQIQSMMKKTEENLSKRIKQLLDFRNIDPATLSILAYEIDYSSTIKYIKVKENIELRTLLKLAAGFEITLYELFDYDGPMPKNKLKGRIKEE